MPLRKECKTQNSRQVIGASPPGLWSEKIIKATRKPVARAIFPRDPAAFHIPVTHDVDRNILYSLKMTSRQRQSLLNLDSLQ